MRRSDERISSRLRLGLGNICIVSAAVVFLLAGCGGEQEDAGDVAAVPLEDAAQDQSVVAGDGDAGDGDREQLQVETGSVPAADSGDGAQSTATVDDAGGAGSGGAQSGGVDSGGLAEAVGPVLAETGDGLTDEELELYLARRYEAYWQAFDLAREAPTATPSVDYPELGNLAAGQQLDDSYDDLSNLFTLGQALREPDVPAVPGLDANTSHRVRVELQGDAVAQIISCLVNDKVRYEVPTGSILSDRVITVGARSTMAKAEGTWKLIRSEATELEPGVAGCWLESEDLYPL